MHLEHTSRRDFRLRSIQCGSRPRLRGGEHKGPCFPSVFRRWPRNRQGYRSCQQARLQSRPDRLGRDRSGRAACSAPRRRPRRLVTLRQRVIFPHHALQLREFADHFGEQIRLGKPRGAATCLRYVPAPALTHLATALARRKTRAGLRSRRRAARCARCAPIEFQVSRER